MLQEVSIVGLAALWGALSVVCLLKACKHPAMLCSSILLIYFLKSVCAGSLYGPQRGSLLFMGGVGGVLVLFVFTISLCVGRIFKKNAGVLLKLKSAAESFMFILVFTRVSTYAGVWGSWCELWGRSNEVLSGESWSTTSILFRLFLLTVVVGVLAACRIRFKCEVAGLAKQIHIS